MKIAKLAVALLIGIAPLARAEDAKPAAAPAAKPAAKPADKPSFHATAKETVTSKVKSVDQKTRMVTLVNEAGEELTFKAGEQIKNLPQLKVGDTVTATVTESISARVLKPGESGQVASENTTVATAALGAKPAGYAAKDVYMVVTIVAIDKEHMVVTLKGPQGNTWPVKAKEKKNVDKLAVGDAVEIHATQALAIEVTAPK